ncbi:MAG: metallophosphoesterase family protein [Terriglobia bacterium]
MRFLIISDIHANLEALEAVLESAEGKYEKVACCGDIVGYGPDPNAVTSIICQIAPAIIRGNHEKAAIGLVDLSMFNPLAKKASVWTQEQLTLETRGYLEGIIAGPLDLDRFTLAHGSLIDEDQYVVDLDDASGSFSSARFPVTFIGHTHIQGGFVQFTDGRQGVLNPEISGTVMESHLRIDPQNTYLINPGAVGQPRDHDPRAAFIIYDQDEGVVRYFRTPYAIEKTQQKMRLAHLPHYLIDRLKLGR